MPPTAEPSQIRTGERPKSHAHAADTLGDVPFLVYAAVQAIKLFLSLVGKRWPHLV